MTKAVDLYDKHCENLRVASHAIKIVEIDLREAISCEEKSRTYVYTKILSYLITSWAEIRLVKLINEKGAFTEAEKQKIYNARSLKLRWKKALDIAFCNALNIQNLKNFEKRTDIPYTSRCQFKAIERIINEELNEGTELRNRIAHGQWLFAFSDSKMGKISDKLTKNLRIENIQTLEFRLNIFKNLSQIIHDLAISRETFKKDFNKNYKKIEETERRLKDANFDIYQKNLILKKKRGLQRKRTQPNMPLASIHC